MVGAEQRGGALDGVGGRRCGPRGTQERRCCAGRDAECWDAVASRSATVARTQDESLKGLIGALLTQPSTLTACCGRLAARHGLSHTHSQVSLRVASHQSRGCQTPPDASSAGVRGPGEDGRPVAGLRTGHRHISMPSHVAVRFGTTVRASKVPPPSSAEPLVRLQVDPGTNGVGRDGLATDTWIPPGDPATTSPDV